MFSNLLDESKRQEDNPSIQALYTNSNYKGKKPWKVSKTKYCTNCKKTSHNVDKCIWLHPELAPPNWKFDKNGSTSKDREPNKAREQRDNRTEVLYCKGPTEEHPSYTTPGPINSPDTSAIELCTDFNISTTYVEDIEEYLNLELGEPNTNTDEKVFISNTYIPTTITNKTIAPRTYGTPEGLISLNHQNH